MASFVVFNTANTKASIESPKGPAVRLLGLHLSRSEAVELAASRLEEARIGVMSTANNATCVLHWNVCSNDDLCGLAVEVCKQRVHDEALTVDDRVAKWIDWRKRVHADVDLAAHEHKMRPIDGVRATWLLSRPVFNTQAPGPGAAPTAAPTTTAASGLDSAKVAQTAEPTEEPRKTVDVRHDQERRGQAWALVAIFGDAKYAEAKDTCLEQLGLDWANFLRAHYCIETFEEAEKTFLDLPEADQDALFDYFRHDVGVCKKALTELSEEPLVAFLRASDDPESLDALAADLEGHEVLRHADLCVVRMYEWLVLDYKYSHNVKHTVRNKKAAEFMSNLHKASPEIHGAR